MIVVMYYPCSVHGHLALALTGLGKDKNIYISFYPNIGLPKAYFRLHNLKHDGDNITGIVVLPSEESCGYGLSEEAIFDWWKNKFNPDQEGYGLFNNNCSRIVYRALCIGQEQSASLNHSLVTAKSWFCETPWGIFDYTRSLGKQLLQNHQKQDELYLQFAELKEICELGKVNPFDQVTALHTRIKQFTSTEYSLIINKIFCDGIKKTLDTFHLALVKDFKQPSFDKLRELSKTNDLTGVDIDAYYEKLRALADYLSTTPASGLLERAAVLFGKKSLEEKIKQVLFATLIEYMNAFEHHHLIDKERIRQTLEIIREKVIDSNNPLKEFMQFGGKIMPPLYNQAPRKG